jgi:two-component system chemotaxis sensor kinase CheA
MDRDKYRRLFLDEAREGLSLIGNELVAVEKAQREGLAGGDALRPRFDAVFRSAHSLKGMGAAMGYVRFAALAHRLEDLADLGRQGQSLPAEAYDLLLAGVDVLEGCVGGVEAGVDDPDAGDLAERVATFVEGLKRLSAPSGSAPSLPLPAPVTPSSLMAAPSPSTSAAVDAVLLRVQLAADASAPQVRAFVVVKTLSALSGFVDATPSGEALRQKELPEFIRNRQLEVRFAAGANVDDAVARARGCQGVADVRVERPEHREKEPEAAKAMTPNAEVDRTIRVRTALLDDLIDSVGEVLLARSRLRALSVRLDQPELSDLVDEVERLTRELHGRVVAARMTPLSLLAERLPRVVRDLARQQGKSVDFSMVGMDIELDRAILDELQAPLVHMVRNAVDHGHEGDEARTDRGVAATMRLVLRAARDRDRVLLTLTDDGRGMDPKALKDKALKQGIIDRTRADALSDEQALELVCLPGFSTAEQVSQTSGRGVGMDVVKSSLEKLGGTLRLASTRGQGTTITLQLPLTVAIIHVLVVDVSRETAVVMPVARVEAAVGVEDDVVSVAAGRTFLRVGADLVPLLDLASLLGLPAIVGAGTAILVRGPEGLVALRVERIAAQEEVVAKPLHAPLSAVPWLAGAAILADGRAAFILEPTRLDAG